RVVVGGSDHVQNVGGRAAHDGIEIVVGQGKLLRQRPQAIDAGDGVVVVAHGLIAAINGKFIHASAIYRQDVGVTVVQHICGIDGGEQARAHRVAVSVNLSESGIAGLKPVDSGESTEEVIEAVVLHDHDNQVLDGRAGAHLSAAARG